MVVVPEDTEQTNKINNWNMPPNYQSSFQSQNQQMKFLMEEVKEMKEA